jgi:hypothetical protein
MARPGVNEINIINIIFSMTIVVGLAYIFIEPIKKLWRKFVDPPEPVVDAFKEWKDKERS